MTAYHSERYYDAKSETEYLIEYHHDETLSTPWDEFNYYGNVSEWTKRGKHPGELVLAEDCSGYKLYYDFQGAIKKLRHERHAKGDDLVKIARQEFEYLRDWYDGEWYYMSIVVTPITEDGDELRSKSHGLWGIESNSSDDYIEEIIEGLITEVEAMHA